MVLVADALCSSLRNCRLAHSRRHCLLLLRALAPHCDDQTRLQTIIPYAVSLLPEDAPPVPEPGHLAPVSGASAAAAAGGAGGVAAAGVAGFGIATEFGIAPAPVVVPLVPNRGLMAAVRCAAVETITSVIQMVGSFTPRDAALFVEYLFPALSLLPRSPEDSVRAAYASALARLAYIAVRFLAISYNVPVDPAERWGEAQAPSSDHGKDMEASSKNHAREGEPVPLSPPSPSPCHMSRLISLLPSEASQGLSHLRETIRQVLEELAAPSPSSSRAPPVPVGDSDATLTLVAGSEHVRVALLRSAGCLGAFFGRQLSTDALLPLLISFLNDPSPSVRVGFFSALPGVCYAVGPTAVTSFILPCIEQALLNEGSARVVASTLDCLTDMGVGEGQGGRERPPVGGGPVWDFSICTPPHR